MPSWAFNTAAQSPIAQSPACPVTDMSGLTLMRPRSTGTSMVSISGFGRVPIVEMTVAPSTRAPLSVTTPRAGATMTVRVGILPSSPTPSFIAGAGVAPAGDPATDNAAPKPAAADDEEEPTVASLLSGASPFDLDTLEIDRELAPRLLREVPADRIAVAESGYEAPDQVGPVRGLDDAVLIGTSLMRSADPAAFIAGVKA